MALGSHLITVRRLEKYINDVIGKKANLPNTNKTIIGNISQINSDLTNNTCANLLNPTAQTQTINGVTFTNNGDGTYTVNGTATAMAYIRINSLSPIREAGKYKLIGCPNGGGSNTFQEVMYVGSTTIVYNQNADGIVVNIPSDYVPNVQLYVYAGSTYDNLLFKPMLTTDLNAKYDDYVPYTGVSGRLNEDVAEIYEKVEDNADAISQINSDLTDSNAHLPIYGTTKGQGLIQDALAVDLTNVDGLVNRVGYVNSDYTNSLPSDCGHGIREVFYYSSTSVFVKITGADIYSKYAEWGNVYNGSWTGWVRL